MGLSEGLEGWSGKRIIRRTVGLFNGSRVERHFGEGSLENRLGDGGKRR